MMESVENIISLELVQLVQIMCAECRRHFCLNHRYPPDHQCTKQRENPRCKIAAQ